MAIIIIAVVISIKSDDKKKFLDESCTGNSDCKGNLVCDIIKKVCKSSIGSNCVTLDDCVTGTVSCKNGICTNI